MALKKSALMQRQRDTLAAIVALEPFAQSTPAAEKAADVIATRAAELLGDLKPAPRSSANDDETARLSDLRIDVAAIDVALRHVDELLTEETDEFLRRETERNRPAYLELLRESALTVLKLRRLNAEREAFLASLAGGPLLPGQKIGAARLLGSTARTGAGWELVTEALRCGAISEKDLKNAD